MIRLARVGRPVTAACLSIALLAVMSGVASAQTGDGELTVTAAGTAQFSD